MRRTTTLLLLAALGVLAVPAVSEARCGLLARFAQHRQQRLSVRPAAGCASCAQPQVFSHAPSGVVLAGGNCPGGVCPAR